MTNKLKKCKGINRAKGFNGCGVETYYRKFGLCPKCLSDWFDSENGKIYFQKQILWKATKNSRELDQQRKERKARNTLGDLKKQTQLLVNKYIRERDKGKPCISSGIPWKRDFDAGHCFSVGSYEGLRYEEDNIHAQSIQDNRYKEGNHLDYLINLPERISKERFDKLLEKAENYKKHGHKFSRPELLEIQKYYKEKLNNLKS